ARVAFYAFGGGRSFGGGVERAAGDRRRDSPSLGTARLQAVVARRQYLRMPPTTSLGQPIGFPVPDWTPPPRPPREPIAGRFGRLEPLDPARHADALYHADSLDPDGRSFTYLPYGPFPTLDPHPTSMPATCPADHPP